MADIHHHHTGAVVEEREGPATVIGVLAVAALIGFLIWLFAFSGLVFNRHTTTSDTGRGGNGGTSVTVDNGNNTAPNGGTSGQDQTGGTTP